MVVTADHPLTHKPLIKVHKQLEAVAFNYYRATCLNVYFLILLNTFFLLWEKDHLKILRLHAENARIIIVIFLRSNSPSHSKFVQYVKCIMNEDISKQIKNRMRKKEAYRSSGLLLWNVNGSDVCTFSDSRLWTEAESSMAVPDHSNNPHLPVNLDKPPHIPGFIPIALPTAETFKEKFIRKTKENPFVPIGEWQAGVQVGRTLRTSTHPYCYGSEKMDDLWPGGF